MANGNDPGFCWGPFCTFLTTLVGDNVAILLTNGVTITGMLSAVNDCSYLTLQTCVSGVITSSYVVIRSIATIAKT
ncbi:MAG: hypothetical protein M0Z27_03265 [Thermaerobacter sp.]|jgi:small nuclear ribonucleoprotein (snRNP)-like protein|nr:hypothetical protein [Thermaerobacter sp.]MDA8145068.1 hypothetical protein [Thermaerobacter sp.]